MKEVNLIEADSSVNGYIASGGQVEKRFYGASAKGISVFSYQVSRNFRNLLLKLLNLISIPQSVWLIRAVGTLRAHLTSPRDRRSSPSKSMLIKSSVPGGKGRLVFMPMPLGEISLVNPLRFNSLIPN